jgi:hypothetical protein
VRILACDLSALDHAQRARHSALRAELRARRLDAREVADGYEFSYPVEPEMIVKLAEFVTLERRCCPFFNFALGIAAGAAEIRLTIGGDSDVKAFLKGQQG